MKVIILNGRKTGVSKDSVTFEQIVTIAGMRLDQHRLVAYKDDDKVIVWTKDAVVSIKDGMEVEVA